MLGDFTHAPVGMVNLAVWVVETLHTATKPFNSERILTPRFTFGHRKEARPAGDG
ncbi:MAG: hypothetical protein JRN06_04460 [Nitrososphaerota archaeon]|nr:hypothetical protein [Nitrososphaerota archaeon]MDG7023874.1 hypothetical protein [Nitrososphaerota archaeon]